MKKMLSMLLATLMVLSLLAGCGSNTNAPATTDTPAAADTTDTTASGEAAAVEPFTGSNVFEAVEWAQRNFPDATVIRYANQTSSANFEANGGSIAAACLYLAKELPIRTEGRYRLEVYADGILASSVDDIVGGLKEGTFEMNCLTAGSWSSYTDAFAEINVPFLFSSCEHAEAVLEAGLLDEMYARAEADVPGVLFRGINAIGFRELTNNKKEITTPADVSGLKLRTLSDPIQIAAWEALGASVVSVPYSDLYSSLQQGMIDGEENPALNLWNEKLYEVQKYMTMTNHLFTLSCQIVSKDFYDSMSAEDQQILEELIAEAQVASFDRYKEMSEEAVAHLEDAGMIITYLDDAQLQAFKDAMAPAYDMCIETMGQERWDALQNYLTANTG